METPNGDFQSILFLVAAHGTRWLSSRASRYYYLVVAMFDIGMAEMIIVGGAAILLLGELDPICTYLLLHAAEFLSPSS